MAPRVKTSLPKQNGTIQHITHPHALIKQAFEDIEDEGYENDEFECDGCSVAGSGSRYHCKQCSFDLHEDCATCPAFLTSSIHPNHPLERIWEGSENDNGLSRLCDVCGNQVKGLFYKCSAGASDERSNDKSHYFFIHPTCSKFQPQLHPGTNENQVRPSRSPQGQVVYADADAEHVRPPHPSQQQVAWSSQRQVAYADTVVEHVRPSHPSQQQAAWSSQQRVAYAEADAEQVRPSRLPNRKVTYVEADDSQVRPRSSSPQDEIGSSPQHVSDAKSTGSTASTASKYAAKMTAKANKYIMSQRGVGDGHADVDADAAKYEAIAEMTVKTGKFIFKHLIQNQ